MQDYYDGNSTEKFKSGEIKNPIKKNIKTMWIEKELVILPSTNKSSIGLNKSTNRLYTAHEAVHREMHHLLSCQMKTLKRVIGTIFHALIQFINVRMIQLN